MIFRRSRNRRARRLFPPELDAGTPTESGGDVYALYKVLRAGQRIVYDPGTYVFHQHRPDGRALHRTIRGYGVGLSAVLAKLLVEERELAGPKVWIWLWWLYVDALRRRARGRADAVDVRIGWDYLAGGLAGGALWLRSKRRWDPGRPDRKLAPAADGGDRVAAPSSHVPAEPLLSVVVEAAASGAERACIDALEREADVELEVIVAEPGDMWNAAALKARGELLLFLGAGTMPKPGLSWAM